LFHRGVPGRPVGGGQEAEACESRSSGPTSVRPWRSPPG
jgi:hypothetical protein